MRIGVLTEEVDNEDVALALKAAGEKLGAEVVIFNPNDCAVLNFAQPQVLHKGEPLDGLDVCLFRGAEKKLEFKLYLIEYLAKLGTVMVNTSQSIRLCNNKFETQTMLNSIGVKTPNTVAIVEIEQLEQAVKSLDSKFPMIVKTVSGSHGVGVIKVDTIESLKSIVQLLLAQGTDLMLQEFIEHKESGRIMTIGDRVVASVMRSIPEGDFRSNLDQGAELSHYQATPEESEVALKVSKALGCIICAIDYITDANGEMVIFEANSSPGLKGIQSVNEEVNIAEEIIQYVMSLVGAPSEVAATNAAVTDEPSEVDDEEEEEVDGKKKKKKKINTLGYVVIPHAGITANTDPDHDGDNDTAMSDNDDLASANGNATDDEAADGGAVDTEDEEEEVLWSPDDHVGFEEQIVIKRINDNIPFDGKTDTGATRCSLGASNIEVGDHFVRFTINDITYKVPLVRTVGVRSANGRSERPIVKFNVEFNGQSYDGIEFNIADRGEMKYQVLIGRNLLEHANVIVNPNV